MKLRTALAPKARRGLVAGVVAICATAGAVAFAIASGGSTGASTHAGTIGTESPAAFRAAMITYLRAESLNYRWVVCVRTPHRYRGVGVVRCNVDFGEPHIFAYCSVLRGGHLLTSAQDSSIPCGHDNSGYSARIVQYG